MLAKRTPPFSSEDRDTRCQHPILLINDPDFLSQ